MYSGRSIHHLLGFQSLNNTVRPDAGLPCSSTLVLWEAGSKLTLLWIECLSRGGSHFTPWGRGLTSQRATPGKRGLTLEWEGNHLLTWGPCACGCPLAEQVEGVPIRGGELAPSGRQQGGETSIKYPLSKIQEFQHKNCQINKQYLVKAYCAQTYSSQTGRFQIKTGMKLRGTALQDGLGEEVV